MDILIVDDHQLFLEGFSLLLKKLDSNVSIHNCNSSQSVLTLISNRSAFDLIILDIGMPDIDGLTLFNMLRKQGILAPVVFVSATENIKTISNAIYLGASGVIPKQCDSKTLLDGLGKVLDGEVYIHEDFVPHVEHELDNISRSKSNGTKLTTRQLEVLRMMSNGSSNKDIARLLSISEATVKTHISIIFQSLDAGNRLECVRKAESMGLIDVKM